MGRSEVNIPRLLTHYCRPFSEPLLNISRASESERATILSRLAEHEPLPLRLTRPDYFSKRARIEEKLRSLFSAKGGSPQRTHPHYFILGTFSLWDSDGSRRVEIPLDQVPSKWLSFTLTDSFFNFYKANLRGVPIPERDYHQQVFTLDELATQLERHRLPTTEWQSDPARRFEPYVEAQIWSDQPVAHLLPAPTAS